MPLPKKGKVKKARKQKSSTLGEERHKKASPEAVALKQHLVLQRDLAKQAMIDREGFRRRLTELERDLEEAQKDKKDMYEEMIRQHQQFQRQTDSQIQRLEAEKKNLQGQLAACQKTLQRSEEDRANISEEKDKAVALMQQKVEEMEKECERILHVSQGWEGYQILVPAKNLRGGDQMFGIAHHQSFRKGRERERERER
ncbi:coiled-coil domain-containing protein 153 isoform X1 [Ahaetulla prasina]|uniref:coiled-coil domain-containing protein 153 isoform X1 n=1 Tax=Ahaetulla prasina TaxID=499056 RepID=UPI0026479FD5|nr:coiled-coil domain-containing protein 153 isoform X1 [Ahaetulla prasina]